MNARNKVWQQPWVWWLLCGVLLVICVSCFAEDTTPKDVLAGTLGDMKTTLDKSGRKWLYVIEGISALIAYRATKNVYILGSVLAVAVFINVLLTFV